MDRATDSGCLLLRMCLRPERTAVSAVSRTPSSWPGVTCEKRRLLVFL